MTKFSEFEALLVTQLPVVTLSTCLMLVDFRPVVPGSAS